MGYEFFGEKIIFPSAPVPGINNDQSLTKNLPARVVINACRKGLLHAVLLHVKMSISNTVQEIIQTNKNGKFAGHM